MARKFDIIKKLLPKYEAALAELADQTGREIQTAYDDVIDEFYASYSPVSYDRTYSLYSASNRSRLSPNARYYENVGTLSYTAGIEVDASFMDSDYVGWAPNGTYTDAEIFNRAYNGGIHGFCKADLKGFSKKMFHTIPPKAKKAPSVRMQSRFSHATNKSAMDRKWKVTAKKYFG